MDKVESLRSLVGMAREELSRRTSILNNMFGDAHPDLIGAASLEVTAQTMRLNALISEYKEEVQKDEQRESNCNNGCPSR